MPMDPQVVRQLLFEEEGSALDFKRDQYRFYGASDEEKAELLKDILAFVNSARRTDAYILLGVQEQAGAPAEIVGVQVHLADSDLQQFVNSKVNQPVTLTYRPCEIEGRQVGVIQIPVQERPRFVVKAFGKLQPNVVYVRRGSATDIARPDEISRMGADDAAASAEAPLLSVAFFSHAARSILDTVPAIESLILRFHDRRDLPDYHDGPALETLNRRMGHPTNIDYWRDLAWYTTAQAAFTALNVAVVNGGGAVAHDVRVELRVATDVASLLDETEYPLKPRKTRGSIASGKVVARPTEPTVRVQHLGQVNVATIAAGKVQPHSIMWLSDSLYFAAHRSGEIELQGSITADNLVTPAAAALKLLCTSTQREMSFQDLGEIERDRFAAEEGRAHQVAFESLRKGRKAGG